MIRIKALTLSALIMIGVICFSTSDVKCPASCSDYCAYAYQADQFGCVYWADGFAGTRSAEAIVKGVCGEFPLPVVFDYDIVHCHEQIVRPGDGDGDDDDDCAGCGTGTCPPNCNPY